MKKSIKFLALALAFCQTAAFTSCSSDDDTPTLPKVQTVASHMNFGTDPVDIYIQVDQAPAANLTVPFHCSGDAVEGTDYALSANQFVIKAGETSAYVTMTRPSATIAENSKTMTLNLDQNAGYELGLSNYTQVTVLGENGYAVSFVQSEGKIVEEAEFTIELLDMTGDTYKSEVAETFQLEVDELNSTAVEGEHFSFPGGKTITVDAKSSVGSFKVKALKVEDGKDKLVLRIADKSGYAAGPNPTLTITVAPLDNFAGTWSLKEFVNEDLFASYMVEASELPTITAGEQVVLTGDTQSGYTFDPKFTGGLKNYFGEGSRQITYNGQVEKLFQEVNWGEFFQVYSFSVPDVNYLMSATFNEKKTCTIGLRLVEADGAKVLEMTIDDYNIKEDNTWGMCMGFMEGMNGLTAGEWMPIRLHFTRAN